VVLGMYPSVVCMLSKCCTTKLNALRLILFFEARSQAGLELTILLPQLSKCWDYSCVPHAWLVPPLSCSSVTVLEPSTLLLFVHLTPTMLP
jgi:hypothetical protein